MLNNFNTLIQTLVELILKAGPGTKIPHGHGASLIAYLPSFTPHTVHSTVSPRTHKFGNKSFCDLSVWFISLNESFDFDFDFFVSLFSLVLRSSAAVSVLWELYGKLKKTVDLHSPSSPTYWLQWGRVEVDIQINRAANIKGKEVQQL